MSNTPFKKNLCCPDHYAPGEIFVDGDAAILKPENHAAASYLHDCYDYPRHKAQRPQVLAHRIGPRYGGYPRPLTCPQHRQRHVYPF